MPFKWRKVLIILKVANGFQKWDCPFCLLLEIKVHNSLNIFFQKLSETSYFSKSSVSLPIISVVPLWFNILINCFVL